MDPIAYERTPKDWAAFVRLAHRRLRGAPFAIMMGFVTCGFIAITRFLDPEGVHLPAMLATTGLYVFAVLLYASLSSGRHVKPGGSVLGKRSIRLDAQGVEDTGAHNKVLFAWSGITDVTRSKDLVVLWSDPAAGVFIPVRDFASEAEITTFVAFATERAAAARGTG
ncbi:MAG: YcxB family protein [Hyphomicrobiales bacterium]|nr:MAG: YcxB family protein [Hyphomicrobiales bacterium]